MEFFGYISLTIMGIILGIVGAGGSILTIPILIYLLGTPILLATSYSLILVGTSAFMASIYYRNSISVRKAIHFAIIGTLNPTGSSVIVALTIDK